VTCKATTHQYDLVTRSRHDFFSKCIFKKEKKGEDINKNKTRRTCSSQTPTRQHQKTFSCAAHLHSHPTPRAEAVTANYLYSESSKWGDCVVEWTTTRLRPLSLSRGHAVKAARCPSCCRLKDSTVRWPSLLCVCIMKHRPVITCHDKHRLAAKSSELCRHVQSTSRHSRFSAVLQHAVYTSQPWLIRTFTPRE